MSKQSEISQLKDKKKPKIESVANFPDGHTAMVVSFPLRKTHWIFQDSGEPPKPLDMASTEERMFLESKFKDVVKYAVKCSTMSGKYMDFDPDAMIQNFMVGMFGYYKNFPRDTIKIKKEIEGRPLIEVVLSKAKELENIEIFKLKSKIAELEKELNQERQKTIGMIDINFFMKFEQFFSRNQHTFHGDNCSTCCDLVKEFIEKDLKKRVEKI